MNVLAGFEPSSPGCRSLSYLPMSRFIRSRVQPRYNTDESAFARRTNAGPKERDEANLPRKHLKKADVDSILIKARIGPKRGIEVRVNSVLRTDTNLNRRPTPRTR